jgi:O-antigen/teichoic acid export membrane protein/glycosyltransferase involved in cell wall biosynthesis
MVSTNERPIHINFDIYQSSLYPMMVDGISIDQAETWIIPAIKSVGKDAKKTRSSGEGYTALIRDLVKSSGIYALAAFASPLVSLVLAPFLTHTLSHSDYGALALLDTVIDLVVGLTQLSLGSAFFRAYNYDYESRRDRSAVLSTVIVLLSLTSIPVAIAMIAASSWLSILLLNSPSYSDSIKIVGLIILLQDLTVPGFSWLRAEKRATLYSILAIVNLVVNLVANIVLVGVFHMGVPGALLGIGSGYAIVVVCTLPALLLRAGIRPRLDVAWNLLSFGFPLVSSFIAGWVLQLSDRYLLSHFTSLAETASYSIAYSIGSILAVVIVAPFQLAWPTAMFSIAKREDAANVFQLVFRWYSIFLLFAAFACSLAGIAVLDLFFPPTYDVAATVIPIVALSIAFSGINPLFAVGISVRRKTWLSVISTSISALVNVGVNLVLIPFYGSTGAAVSTLIAYTVLILITYFMNQRIYPVPFEIDAFISVVLIGIVFYVAGSVFAQSHEIYMAWGIRICALCLCGGCFALLGKLQTDRSKKNVLQSRRASVPMKKVISQSPSPMKVCMHVLGVGRTDVRVMREATALVEAGFEVSIVDIEDEGTRPVEEELSGVHFKHILQPGSFNSTRFKSRAFVKAAQVFLRGLLYLLQMPADVYHAHDITALPACYVAARLRHKPLVFDAHELPLKELAGPHRRWLRLLLTPPLSHMVSCSTRIVTTSPVYAQEIRNRYHVPEVSLVRNFPRYRNVQKSDLLRQHLGINPDARIALYQGNIQPDRGLDRLVRAARFLEPNIVIVMMGKALEETLSELEVLIASEGVADRVKIIPPVPYEELLNWTASADIGLNVLPPDYSSSIRMCLPNKLFEYLMAGVPVLSSELDAVAEVIRTYDAGQIVSSLAPSDIATAINTMLTDTVALDRMRRNALDAAKQEFRWEKESKRLVSLYHEFGVATRSLEVHA